MFNESFEEFPRWYEISMQVSASITIPINSIGLIMIAFFSKEQLKNYRYYLLFHQICSMLLDIIINTGTVPVVYSPYPIGSPHGWMTEVFKIVLKMENNTWLQTEIVFHGFLTTAMSVEILFLYRYQVIIPITHPWRLSGISKFLTVLIYHIIWMFLVSLSFHNIMPNDQSAAKDQFREDHPDLAFFVEDKNSLIVTTEVNLDAILVLIVFLTRIGSGLIICCIFILLSRYSLNHTIMSARTRNMHLHLIRILCYQISIPIAAFYIPVFCILTPMLFQIQNTFNLALISFNAISKRLGVVFWSKEGKCQVVRNILDCSDQGFGSKTRCSNTSTIVFFSAISMVEQGFERFGGRCKWKKFEFLPG
ncbi:unnamed protein product [Caenorhabditis angaria]|uniref:G protein-coupled receptor n=1 Tax=Caenorhabditis angaria TaxID=860376 RepID=A0A9P1IYD2_9PELO|nr:unnamed protein product [Caenorhabditis angaria]